MNNYSKPVLYTFPLSANGYRARLLLEYLGVSFDTKLVDLSRGAHREPDYIEINPLGQLPTLVDTEVRVWDSHAIATYVVEQYAGARAESIWPSAPAERAAIASWMYFDAIELHFGIGLARNHFTFGVPLDGEAALKRAHKALAVLDGKLSHSDWLELGRLTLADLTCFPLVSLADEATIDLSAYAGVQTWIRRIEALPIPPKPSLKAYRQSHIGEEDE